MYDILQYEFQVTLYHGYGTLKKTNFDIAILDYETIDRVKSVMNNDLIKDLVSSSPSIGIILTASEQNQFELLKEVQEKYKKNVYIPELEQKNGGLGPFKSIQKCLEQILNY